MGGAPLSSRIVRFGTFQVDLEAGELHKNGKKIRLQEQPFQVLVALLKRAGQVVTREQLRQELWAGDTFVDFDHSLSTAINKIREALGDSAGNPRFVETVPRRGYRFIAPVDGIAERKRARRAVPVAVALAVIIAAGVAVWMLLIRSEEQRWPVRLEAIPFTTDPGEELYPAISPDGKRVAFCRQGNIFVKQVDGDRTETQLTETSAREFSPAWSPDGSQIAFLRSMGKGEGFTIHRKDALAGPEHFVYQSNGVAWYRAGSLWGKGLAWSPNREWLAFVDQESEEEPFSIYSLSLDSHEVQKLTFPASGWAGDHSPTYSADGDQLAFVRVHSGKSTEIYLQSLAGNGEPTGKPEPLTSLGWWIADLDWTSDRHSIVFSAETKRSFKLHRIPLSGGDPEELDLDGHTLHASCARQDNRMVYSVREMVGNIWRGPGPNAKWPASDDMAGAWTRLDASTRWQTLPRYSPDGNYIAFRDSRWGEGAIARCDSDGSDLVRWTAVGGRTPRWSTDGRLVAFVRRGDVFVVPAEGGTARQVTTDSSKDRDPSWSRDGKWVYFCSNRGGEYQIWKTHIEDGTAEQVTRDGGGDAFESADGQFVYYSAVWPAQGIWRQPVGGGEATKELENAGESRWALLEDGICYQDQKTRTIRFLRFATGKIEHVAEYPEKQGLGPGFATSPDGRWVLCTLSEPGKADIMLVESSR